MTAGTPRFITWPSPSHCASDTYALWCKACHAGLPVSNWSTTEGRGQGTWSEQARAHWARLSRVKAQWARRSIQGQDVHGTLETGSLGLSPWRTDRGWMVQKMPGTGSPTQGMSPWQSHVGGLHLEGTMKVWELENTVIKMCLESFNLDPWREI